MKCKGSSSVYHLLLYLCCSLLVLPRDTMAEKAKCPVLRATGVSDEDKTGCYTVVLNKATSADMFESILSRVLNMTEDAKVYASVQRVAKAFTVRLSEIAIEAVS